MATIHLDVIGAAPAVPTSECRAFVVVLPTDLHTTEGRLHLAEYLAEQLPELSFRFMEYGPVPPGYRFGLAPLLNKISDPGKGDVMHLLRPPPEELKKQVWAVLEAYGANVLQ